MEVYIKDQTFYTNNIQADYLYIPETNDLQTDTYNFKNMEKSEMFIQGKGKYHIYYVDLNIKDLNPNTLYKKKNIEIKGKFDLVKDKKIY